MPDVRDERRKNGWLDGPWELLPNRVSQFYRGGALLDRFRGIPDPTDTDRPEDWVGSATRAWTPPGAPRTDEGLSSGRVGDEVRRILDVVTADPPSIAGDLAASEPTTGILVKLLDAGIRLPVHAHPTRAFARARLGSPFGKAEAWIILGTRDVPGEPPPHVRLGFRRDVGRDELRGWIDEQRTDELLASLVARPARTGDVWFVPPGTPHAIGAGVFILEVQEPTDFSIVLETAGFPIDRDDASLRLGWDVALDAIDRRGRDGSAIATLRSSIDGGLPGGAAPFFWARRIVAAGERRLELPRRFVVGVVTGGQGAVVAAGGRLEIRAGDAFALPAAANADARLVTDGRLEVIVAGSAGPPGRR
jgi:mannose-6-phosphate isomerase